MSDLPVRRAGVLKLKNRGTNPRVQASIRYQNKHRMSLEEVEKLFAEQEGLCPICKNTMTLLNSKAKYRAVVDHSHSSGKRRGLICSVCNVILGLANDNVDTLISAVVYLRVRDELE